MLKCKMVKIDIENIYNFHCVFCIIDCFYQINFFSVREYIFKNNKS